MLSLRSLSRSLPRIGRFTPKFATYRTFTAARSPGPLCRWSWTSAPRSLACFSTSARMREAEGGVMEELAAKLAEELKIEREIKDPEIHPPDVKEYLDNSEFKIEDIPGEDSVVLTRQYNDEIIRVSFSIDDLNNIAQDQLPDEALMDEDDDIADLPEAETPRSRKGTINQGRDTQNFTAVPEDSVASADNEAEEIEEEHEGFPAHVQITIERPGKGALQIQAIVQDGLFVVDDVSYLKDASLAHAKSAELDYKTRDLYTGPPFGNLDEELQVMFEKYLEERGINMNMAAFVPNYIDYKEQREYTRWLEQVKGFME